MSGPKRAVVGQPADIGERAPGSQRPDAPRGGPGSGSGRAGRRTTTSPHRTTPSANGSLSANATRVVEPSPLGRRRAAGRPRPSAAAAIPPDASIPTTSTDGQRRIAAIASVPVPVPMSIRRRAPPATGSIEPIEERGRLRGEHRRPPFRVARGDPVVAFGLVGHGLIVPRRDRVRGQPSAAAGGGGADVRRRKPSRRATKRPIATTSVSMSRIGSPTIASQMRGARQRPGGTRRGWRRPDRPRLPGPIGAAAS